jgi:Transposase IS116/IS110/IS902 family
MPGVGPPTAIELLRTVGDGSTFASAAHIASYAGLAPATRQSGRSIKGEHQARRGNRTLKGALYPFGLRQLEAPTQPRLPRPETNRGKEPHRRVDMPPPGAGSTFSTR